MSGASEPLLYAGRALSAGGAMVMYVGVALVVAATYGAAFVPWTFLLQAAPGALLANRVRALAAGRTVFWTIVGGQLGLALAAVAVALWPQPAAVAGFLIVLSVLSALTLPLANQTATKWADPARAAIVHTRLNAIQAAVSAGAPLLGGVFSLRFGLAGIFACTALCYAASSACYLVLYRPAEDVFRERVGAPAARTANLPRGSLLTPSAGFLVVFATLAFVINGTEFAVFARSGLTTGQSALVLAAWGAGSAIAFFGAGVQHAITPRGLTALVAAFALLVGAFALIPGLPAVLTGFFLGGIVSSYAIGYIRAAIAREAVVDAIGTWVLIQRLNNAQTVAIYALLGLLLARVGYPVVVAGLIAAAALSVVNVVTLERRLAAAPALG